jgi:hypothetical protein
MEIDITEFVRAELSSARFYSSSNAESGPTAGEDTWEHCKERAENWGVLLLPGAEHIDAARSFIREFGAWTDDDAVMTDDIETRALVLQFVMGDLREAGWTSAYPDEAEQDKVREAQEDGQINSTVYCEPNAFGVPRFYLSLD